MREYRRVYPDKVDWYLARGWKAAQLDFYAGGTAVSFLIYRDDEPAVDDLFDHSDAELGGEG